jgi:tetraacyldisaccharide 4'-kinase
MRQRAFLELISRERTGPIAALLRACLRVCSWVYGLAVVVRLGVYRLRLLPQARAEKPVICVGNLTTGGTGKTPAVAYTVKAVQELELMPAIVSRGYKADDQGNDEMRVLAELCPGVKHFQNPIRSEGAEQAIRQGADVVVLDDGFSHLALARDLDIVLLDALNPFGYGRMLPRGLLREPIRSLRRARFCVFTRSDVATPQRLQDLEDTIRCKGFTGGIAHAAHVPVALRRLDAEENAAPTLLEGKTVAAFCGIGNPLGFRRTLESLGAQFTELGVLGLDDHQRYDEAALGREVMPFLRACKDEGAELAVCTQKDAVKIRQQAAALDPVLPLYELLVEFQVTRGEAELLEAIKAATRVQNT